MHTINQFLYYDAKEKRFVKKTFVTVWQVNGDSAKPVRTYEVKALALQDIQKEKAY